MILRWLYIFLSVLNINSDFEIVEEKIGISDNIEEVNSNASEGNKSYGKSLKNFFGFQRSVNPMQYYCQIHCLK